MLTNPPIFDGHNDVLSRLLDEQLAKARAHADDEATETGRNFFERSEQGHIDLPRAREGGFAGGLFSVYVGANPEAPAASGAVLGESMAGSPVRLPRPLELGYAQRTALAQMGVLYRLQYEAEGALRVVRNTRQLTECLNDGALAAVVHFEAAEPIDPSLATLDVFYEAGLRSLGPVWSRANDFGEGVPYLFPHSPDTGPGLTEPGKELVRACNRLSWSTSRT
jgi:membrane dipeptidase